MEMIGFVGLGTIGGAIAKNIQQAGYPMMVPIAALVEQTIVQAIGRGWSEQGALSLFRLQEEAAGTRVRTRPN